MLDLKFIQKNPELIKNALRMRKIDLDIDRFLKLDQQRRSLIQEVEELRQERNQTSAEVGELKKKGLAANELISRLSLVGESIKELETRKKQLEEEIQFLRLSIANVPHPDVPEGDSDADNLEVKKWGAKPDFSFQAQPHWELGPKLGGLDFERAAKITGSRFALYWGWAAKMERALINFMLDIQCNEHHYQEVLPPFMVNAQSMQNTGQLPKFAADLFKIEDWSYYLIPTAEVPVTNIHADENLSEQDLPLAYAAYTPCFRSEAGSYGKDTKGLIRQHQFNKVELVRFAHPDDSYQQLEILLQHAETVLQRLNLHYRVVTLCSGDLGFSAAKTYDIEVWLPGQEAYREISSCSNFEDFQARRANIRFKNSKNNKKDLVHTLNGSGLAVGRTLIAILENHQQQDGSVIIPKALRPYMQGLEKIDPL